MMPGKTAHAIRYLLLAVTSMSLVGCESSTEPPVEAARRTPPPAAERSPWQISEGSPRVVVLDEADDPELAQAIAQARSTLDDARRQWTDSTDLERLQWSVKWAAPTIDGGAEHVWVKPILYWSAFRIEGLLANPPQTELAAGKGLGDQVSFPVQELSDWVHLLEGRIEGPHEGGFTVKLLDERYGRPD